MASDLTNLQSRRTEIFEELKKMSPDTAGGKPNAPGKNADHVGYRMSLYAELREIAQQMAILTGGSQVDVYGRI